MLKTINSAVMVTLDVVSSMVVPMVCKSTVVDARLSTISGSGETSDNVRTVLLMESNVEASDNVV